MTSTPKAYPSPQLWPVLLLLCLALPAGVSAQEANRLLRIQIRPHQGFTRVTLLFRSAPDYTLSRTPGRVRIDLTGTGSRNFRTLRSYGDSHIGGVYCSCREGGVQLTVPVKEAGAGVQLLGYGSPTALALDIGPAVRRVQRVDIAPGREPILSGTEQFVRDFTTPARDGLPFTPTDVKLLQRLLPEGERQLFQRGEGALYKEQGAEALQIFAYFLTKGPALQALAYYRTGEALCLLERYDEALKSFRQGEALWPGYLDEAPEIEQTYADARARGGDWAGGRTLLVRLIDRENGTAYAPPLLNRLAELSARHGDRAAALEIYRSVVLRAPGSPAAARARMKLADQEMFTPSRDRYQRLLEQYQSIYQAPGDFALRDEALFKIALLQALYGPAADALRASVAYQTCYPRGIFVTIVKKLREELLLPVYREIYAARDGKALAQLALDNREYLERCLSDPLFIPRVGDACRGAGMQGEELALFGFLAEKSWAQSSAAFLVVRQVEDALVLGNMSLAESSARSFLSRFPGDPRAQWMHEQLARIAFQRGESKGVIPELSFLNAKGRRAQFPESYYYLGKALAATGEPQGAERLLTRYAGEAKAGAPLLPDCYFTLAQARVARREYAGGLAAYRAGLKLVSGETADQYHYKVGELCLQLGMVREARDAWQEVVSRDAAGTWGKLAAESLSEIAWRLRIAGELP